MVNAQATRVGEEEDEDSDEDKENEEGSEPEEDTKENQEYFRWEIGYEERLEQMAKRLRDWDGENEGI